jgi:hypothetical protein
MAENYFEQFVYWSVPSVVSETCSPDRCPATDYTASTHYHPNVRQLRSNSALASRCPAIDYPGFQAAWHGNVLREPLSNKGLFQLSAFMSQYGFFCRPASNLITILTELSRPSCFVRRIYETLKGQGLSF